VICQEVACLLGQEWYNFKGLFQKLVVGFLVAVKYRMDRIQVTWREATLNTEYTWHQLAPYIGRMKSSMARSLVTQFSQPGETIYDPFAGAGTVVLEAWIARRHVLAGDLSPYAYVLTKGKIHPPRNLGDAERRLDMCWLDAWRERETIDLRKVPLWVRRFFHPETLRDTLAVRNVMLRRRQYFLLSCLLGILHHWRPGFLSYPCSHTVPYVKDKLYPRSLYPELYTYRDVYPRLRAKVHRAFRRTPEVDRHLTRNVVQSDATKPTRLLNSHKISAIITSPPYMNALSYARDNRLRLWFLGVENHRKLEGAISPTKTQFLKMMGILLDFWSRLLAENGACILVLGAVRRDGKHHCLPQEIVKMANNRRRGLKLVAVCNNVIPDVRRARVRCRSTREETILVLRKGK